MKELKEFIESYDDTKELIGDFVGWVCIVGILFMLAVVGG